MTPHNPETPMTDPDRLDFDKLRAQTTRDTPPADTRQQAAERAIAPYLDAENPHSEACGTGEGDCARCVAEEVAAALASSSPALPEPPAPTGYPHGERLHANLVALSWTPPPGFDPAYVEHIRSMAAADVAEEQQP